MRSYATPAARFSLRRRLLVAALTASVAVPMLSLPLAVQAQEVTADSMPTVIDVADDMSGGTATVNADDELDLVFLPPTSPQPQPIDTDGDGLSDTDERRWGLDPTRHDTDSDGINDGDELYDRYGLTNPINPDTDYDGLRDGAEVFVYFTDPYRPDTDGDGFSDLTEVQQGRDPRVAYR